MIVVTVAPWKNDHSWWSHHQTVTSLLGEVLNASFTASGQVWTPSTMRPNLFSRLFLSHSSYMLKMTFSITEVRAIQIPMKCDWSSNHNLSSLKRRPTRPGCRWWKGSMALKRWVTFDDEHLGRVVHILGNMQNMQQRENMHNMKINKRCRRSRYARATKYTDYAKHA